MARESTAAEVGERAGTTGVPARKLHFSVTGFRNRLHAWYRENARVLPWRGVQDPYATWLSEIMLQQTRVATVRERFHDFLERFPTLQDLAEADEDEVLALWSGLGYYRRARMLHRGAQFVTRELKGKLPRTAVQLRTLPGVGDYTAAAIASIAFGESIAVIDGNVERVLLRVLGKPEDRSGATRAELTTVAQSLVPPALRRSAANRLAVSPGDHNQAMMELGAVVCLPKGPLCLQCPLLDICKTRGEHVTAEREARQSRTVGYLLALRKRGIATEVLLERRAQGELQMPGMLELPSLKLEGVGHREPVLRLRHAITNTNYYVQIFAESAPGLPPSAGAEHDAEANLDLSEAEADGGEKPGGERSGHNSYEDLGLDDGAVLVAESSALAVVRAFEPSLQSQLSAAGRERRLWVSAPGLLNQPLTGLARKALQRLGVMPLPKVRVD